MNFQKTVRSRGFWVISGASVLIAIAVWVIAHLAGASWALGFFAGSLGLLLGAVYVELRTAVSSVSSGTAGLRKLAFEHRNQAQNRGSELRDVLREAIADERKRHSEVIDALDRSRGFSAEEASRTRDDIVHSRNLATEQFRTLDQRVRKVGSQVQDALTQLKKMDEEVEQLMARTDRANSESLAADIRRTLRGTRALEKTMAETVGLEETISRTLNGEARSLERLSEEMAIQRRILSELLLAADFKP